MTIAAVSGQENGLFADNTTSIARAFGSNVQVGSLIVVVAGKFSPSTDAFVAGDCTKSAGTATIGAITLDRSHNIQADAAPVGWAALGIWSCLVTGAGSLTMQVAGALAGSYLLLGSGEYTATNGWDASRLESSNDNGSATDSTTSATTNNATSAGGAIFIAGLNINSFAAITLTPDAAFSQIYESEDGTTNATGSVIRRIVTSGTTDAGDWTTGTSHGGYAAALAVYKEVAAGGSAIAAISSGYHQRGMR